MLNFYLASVDTAEEKSLVSRLYSDYKQMMYKIAYAVLNNAHDAEDAVHDAFINIIRRDGLSKIKGFDREAERSYIAVVAKNAAVGLYNKRRKTAAEDIDEIYSLSGETTTEDEVFAAFDVGRVAKALLKLPANDYEVLYLLLVNELSGSEAAELLNISEGAVRQRAHRAKLRLRKILEEEGGI